MVALVATLAVLCACSSSSSSPKQTPSSTSADPGAVAVQAYLDAVNRLCDDLLPKVVAVTNGGSLDIPLKDFFAQLPAHSKLRADFDRHLAAVPVPPEAVNRSRALAAYIRFANDLDARRLRAARQGQAAYAREIATEKTDAVNDPRIAARDAAGFNESCNAR
jgi:ABC-type Fe3+-hydroxamate transport system substrate-binding protein